MTDGKVAYPAMLRSGAITDAYTDDVVILRADARHLPIEDDTVDLIVTSPPYFGLRSYRDAGEHYEGQIGDETNPDDFVAALGECMAEWRRVLRPGGNVFVNLGDKFAGSTIAEESRVDDTGASSGVKDGQRMRSRAAGRNIPAPQTRARAKSLIGVAWRFAITQIDDGWILRDELIWSKPNAMPESVTDRLRRIHEHIFHFVADPIYYTAVDELRGAYVSDRRTWSRRPTDADAGVFTTRDGQPHGGMDALEPDAMHPLGRLPGDVWEIPTDPLYIPDAIIDHYGLPKHFAAFPQELPRRLITGFCPPAYCLQCGEPRRPAIYRQRHADLSKGHMPQWTPGANQQATGKEGTFIGGAPPTDVTICGYLCQCAPITEDDTDDAGAIAAALEKWDPPATRPAVVLDPFGGTGTTAGVARTLGRFGIHNDLSEDYNRLAKWRIFESGHFAKSEARAWADRQGSLL